MELSMKLKKSGTKHTPIFIMAHGAGAPMDSEWMNQLTDELVSREIQVIRFEFPYMEERRLNGKKRPPNSKKVLLESWQKVIEKVRKNSPKSPIFIGGKSMGGRIAGLIADQVKPEGFIALGFPFHAPGKLPGERLENLTGLKTKTLIIQGTRDTMGTREECLSYPLSKKIQFMWLEDGDHSWKPRQKSGHTMEEHMQTAADTIKNFIG
jgi:predicted alpha/beta-hydrolase family hydrolase